jgi:prepilin-type N-terminal cleavage/methylation domain-containing protein
MSKHRKLDPAREGLRDGRGYTLVELLTSMAILGVMLGVLFSVFDNVQKAWLQGENRVETFTQARAILDLMSRELSQAIAANGITFHGETNRVFFVAPVANNPSDQADLCQVGYEFDPNLPQLTGAWAFQITRHFIEPTSANVLANNWNIRSTWWSTLPLTAPAGDNPSILATNCIVNVQFQYFNSAGNAISPPVNQLPYAVAISMDVVDSRTVTKMRAVPSPSLFNQTWQNITNSTLRTFYTKIYLPNASPGLP